MKMKAKSLTGLGLSDQMLSVLLGLLILRILIIQPLALLAGVELPSGRTRRNNAAPDHKRDRARTLFRIQPPGETTTEDTCNRS